MKLALKKYILRKENSEWGAPSSEKEQFTALTAELSKYKTDSRNGKKQDKRGPKPGNKDKKDQKKKKPVNNDKRWEWKKTPPADKKIFRKSL